MDVEEEEEEEDDDDVEKDDVEEDRSQDREAHFVQACAVECTWTGYKSHFV